MSFITLHKINSVASPLQDAGNAYYDANRLAWNWVEFSGAQWWFGEQRVRLTADLTPDSSTGLLDVTGLGFTLLASNRYSFQFQMIWQTSGTTGLKVGLTCPGGVAVFVATAEMFETKTGGTVFTSDSGLINATGGNFSGQGSLDTAKDFICIVAGTIVTGTTAGNLQLQWAAATGAAGGITPRQGSSGMLWML